ncbi:MAG: signal recognition particle protein [Limnochordaceae bacterium]|nr:signal recognition particle protein [Limnochordaceae bacterium]
MFEALTERLNAVFKRLSGRGRLSERDVDEALREVRLALLEADVNFRVVKGFIDRVRSRATGAEVLEGLAPAHQVVRIVRDELTALLGGKAQALVLDPPWPAVVVMVGLQGSGKTTAAAKLGYFIHKRQGRRVLLVAADLQRPAAIEQLRILSQQAGCGFFSAGQGLSAPDVARAGVACADKEGYEVVIVDTAGRQHVDEELMEEARRIVEASRARQVLLVVDAMTGQDAVNVARAFAERVGVHGVVLTKLDGDARGGAALSVREVTGAPILFAGTGERLEGLEPFYPDRMAGRILGMGDVLSLIERAEQAVRADEARSVLRKIREDSFGLDDFLDQLRQVRRMGPLDQLLSMIPGLGQAKALKGLNVDEKELNRVEAIIQSMTPSERRNPAIIDGSRRRRIAAGSGTRVQDVNRLLRQYEEARRMMRLVTQRGGAALPPSGLPDVK